MSYTHSPSIVEKIAESLRIIPKLHGEEEPITSLNEPGKLSKYPPPEKWENWTEYEADRRKRMGAEANRPHRIKYRQLTR